MPQRRVGVEAADQREAVSEPSRVRWFAHRPGASGEEEQGWRGQRIPVSWSSQYGERNLAFWILPVPVRGSSSTKSNERGRL